MLGKNTHSENLTSKKLTGIRSFSLPILMETDSQSAGCHSQADLGGPGWRHIQVDLNDVIVR